jgi:hypothetical protein
VVEVLSLTTIIYINTPRIKFTPLMELPRPAIKVPREPNMVITIEPFFILPQICEKY